MTRKEEAYQRAVFEHYGNKCACCGEGNWQFLTIDHKNGNGGQDTRFKSKVTVQGHKGYRTGCTNKMYEKIIRAGYPDDLQLMCWNCNSARQFRGGKNKVCPHIELANKAARYYEREVTRYYTKLLDQLGFSFDVT